MHDLLFEHQAEWSPSPNAEVVFMQYGLQLGLDQNQFMQSMRSPATRDRVLADVTLGNPIVQGTPTFVINGQLLPELPGLEGLAARIDAQLAALGTSAK
jgi:protein-disulfide isomerase